MVLVASKDCFCPRKISPKLISNWSRRCYDLWHPIIPCRVRNAPLPCLPDLNVEILILDLLENSFSYRFSCALFCSTFFIYPWYNIEKYVVRTGLCTRFSKASHVWSPRGYMRNSTLKSFQFASLKPPVTRRLAVTSAK